ncbi:MAG: hypothetical protein ACKVT0_12710 [Planctomycetaceae bacterium]
MNHSKLKSCPAKGSLFAVAMWFGVSLAAFADDVPQGVDRPLVTWGVASLERVQNAVQQVLVAAERPELSSVMNDVLARVGDLKGWDRTRPFGAMVMLNPGIAPEPVVVGFAPIDNWETVLANASTGIIQVRTSKEHADRYDIILPKGGQLLLRVVGKYAFFSKKPESLNREFGDPGHWLNESSSKYDFWSTLHFDHVPEGLRTVVIDYLRAGAQEKDEKNPGESEADYQLRRSATESTLDGFELLTTHGKTLTGGWRITADQPRIIGEIVLTPLSDSPLASSITSLGSHADRFAVLDAEGTPLHISTSLVLGERIAEMLEDIIDISYEKALKEIPADQRAGHPIASIYKMLKSTVAARHINQVFRIGGEGPGRMMIVGAMHFSEQSDLDTVLAGVHQAILSDKNIGEVQVNAESHHGIDIHRLKPAKSHARIERFYGKEASLYAARIGSDLWFSFGGTSALDQLKSSIDLAMPESRAADSNDSRTLFLASVNVASWLPMIPENRPEVTQLIQRAFAKGGDTIELRLERATEGLQLRLTMEEGFIRFIGLSIAQTLDKQRK